MSYILPGRRGRIATFALALAVASLGSTALAAPTLVAGDKAAVVTMGHHGRPISSSTDHVVSFNRGGTIYVCAGDIAKAVMGATSQHGDSYTVTSFPGMMSSKTVTVTVGSKAATIDGKDVTLTAPPLNAYGNRLYIPLTFFGSPGLKTKYTQASDGSSGAIIVPKN